MVGLRTLWIGIPRIRPVPRYFTLRTYGKGNFTNICLTNLYFLLTSMYGGKKFKKDNDTRSDTGKLVGDTMSEITINQVPGGIGDRRKYCLRVQYYQT
jgi:hypothetical protein